MRRRLGTIAAGLALVLGGASAGLVMGTNSAAAAEPIVIGSCSTSVKGTPGTPLSLSPSAVLDPVLSIVRAVPVLGPTLAGGVSSAVRGMGDIPLGVIPNADSTIGGGTIAAAAVPRIKAAIERVPLIGPVLGGIVTGVQDALAGTCRIVVTVANTAAAPVQKGVEKVGEAAQKATEPLAPGTDQPGGPGKPGGNPGGTPGGGGGTPAPPAGGGGGGGAPPLTNPIVGGGVGPGGVPLYNGLGRVPRDYYGGIPAFSPGLFTPSPAVRYGGAVPGYSPEFGILGTEPGDDGVQAAGHAEAIGPVGGNRVELPVLLAVLILSGVTAALVRTWVLRRTVAG